MKDDHQEDHLEVGLQTPDGTFYKVIPSEFLRTTVRLSACEYSLYHFLHCPTFIKSRDNGFYAEKFSVMIKPFPTRHF